MTEHPIPQASLERLRTTFAQFEQLAAVISEAMGLGPNVRARLDMQRGLFEVEDGEGAAIGAERTDGVAA